MEAGCRGRCIAPGTKTVTAAEKWSEAARLGCEWGHGGLAGPPSPVLTSMPKLAPLPSAAACFCRNLFSTSALRVGGALGG